MTKGRNAAAEGEGGGSLVCDTSFILYACAPPETGGGSIRASVDSDRAQFSWQMAENKDSE